jgi:hypothetical protein
MATVIILILNHLNVETLNISVHVEAPFAKINRTGSKMITETHQTAIDRILSFAEKDENEQAAINQIQLWFNTGECSSLPIIDATSKAFWAYDKLYASSQNSIPAVQSFAADQDIVQIRPDVDDYSMCIDTNEGDVN